MEQQNILLAKIDYLLADLRAKHQELQKLVKELHQLLNTKDNA